jgi:hypothetical protein
MHRIGKKSNHKPLDVSRDVAPELLVNYPELYGSNTKEITILSSLKGREGVLHVKLVKKKLKLIFFQLCSGDAVEVDSVKVEDVRKSLSKKTISTNIGEVRIPDPTPLEKLINTAK